MSIFEKAIRTKLRFESSKGILTVEDLWDLTLPQLDNLWKKYNKLAKEAEEESLLATRSKSDSDNTLRIEILRHIVTTKQAEALDATTRLEKAAQKRKIMDLIARKQESEMEGKSLDELFKELEALD